MKHKIIIFCIFSFTYAAPLARAESDIENTERRISKGVQTLSTKLDSFFSRQDLEIEDTGSRLKLGFAAYYEEYKDPSYNFLVGFRLILPHTQEKLQLLVMGDEEDLYERQEGETSTPDKKISDSINNQKISVGIRSLFHKSKKTALVFDTGVKIKSPLDPFARLTGRRSFFFKDYELRFLERFYWYESIQWGSSTSIDLDRPFAPGWLGRFSNNGVLDMQSGLWQLDHFVALHFGRHGRHVDVRRLAAALADLFGFLQNFL